MKSIIDERIAEYWRRKNTGRRDNEQAIKEKIEQEQMGIEDGRKRRRNKQVKAKKRKRRRRI